MKRNDIIEMVEERDRDRLCKAVKEAVDTPIGLAPYDNGFHGVQGVKPEILSMVLAQEGLDYSLDHAYRLLMNQVGEQILGEGK